MIANRCDVGDQVLLSTYMDRRRDHSPGITVDGVNDTTHNIVPCRDSVSKIIETMVFPDVS